MNRYQQRWAEWAESKARPTSKFMNRLGTAASYALFWPIHLFVYIMRSSTRANTVR